jgi:hypothetical protein
MRHVLHFVLAPTVLSSGRKRFQVGLTKNTYGKLPLMTTTGTIVKVVGNALSLKIVAFAAANTAKPNDLKTPRPVDTDVWTKNTVVVP